MSDAIFIPWQNRLAEVMRKPGGARVEDAIKQAAENLEEIREPCLETMDEQLKQLDRLCAEGGAQPDDELKRQIYVISNDVHAVAGVFSLTALSGAAFSLCELVDRFRSIDRWNQAAVAVHLSSFRLLRRADVATDHASVLEGLHRLTEQSVSIGQ
jgi:uncharacterized protein YicC (UPF0701 family)